MGHSVVGPCVSGDWERVVGSATCCLPDESDLTLRSRIPLTVIGGFLGAGKTTLLNYWLRESRGKRFAVLVNDFGAINIDAALIASADSDTIALTNGCVCCSIGDDLSQALIRVLDASPPFDGIVIEASGVSDPWRIAQIGLAEPGLSLDGVIVLLDAQALADNLANPLLRDSIERPLAHADLVVLNKVDLADDAALETARDWIRRNAPSVHCCETTNAEIALPLLSGAHLTSESNTAPPHDCHEHCEHPEHAHSSVAHDQQFATWSCAPSRVYSLVDVKAWLKAPPAGVLRLKGFVETQEYGWSEVQFSGRTGSVRRALASPANPRTAALVAIGLNGSLPVAALISYWT